MKSEEFKTIGKMLDSALESYETKLKSGDYEMTSKDAEVLAHVVLAKLGMKGLCAVEKLTKMLGGEDEKGEAKGFGMKRGSVNPLSIFSSIQGLTSQDNGGPYSTMPIPPHPYYPMDNDTQMRRGVPGSGRGVRSAYENDDMEMRHRGKNGRWVRNEYGDDDYEIENRSRGNGGQGGNTPPQNNGNATTTTSPGTGATTGR